MNVKTLSLLVLGQDEQESGNNQVYTGSGDADTVQFSITSSPTLTVAVRSCAETISGFPETKLLKQ